MKRVKLFSLALALSLVGAVYAAGGYAQSTAQESSKERPSAGCCASGGDCCKEGASCCAKHKAGGSQTAEQACAMNQRESADCCKEGASCCTGDSCSATARKQ